MLVFGGGIRLVLGLSVGKLRGVEGWMSTNESSSQKNVTAAPVVPSVRIERCMWC